MPRDGSVALRPLVQAQQPLPAAGEDEDIVGAEDILRLNRLHHRPAVLNGDDIQAKAICQYYPFNEMELLTD